MARKHRKKKRKHGPQLLNPMPRPRDASEQAQQLGKQVATWGESGKYKTHKKRRKLKHNVKARIDLNAPQPKPTARDLLRHELLKLSHYKNEIAYFTDLSLRGTQRLNDAHNRVAKAQMDAAKLAGDIQQGPQRIPVLRDMVVEQINKVQRLEAECKAAPADPVKAQQKKAKTAAKLVVRKSKATTRMAKLHAQQQKLMAQFTPDELRAAGYTDEEIAAHNTQQPADDSITYKSDTHPDHDTETPNTEPQ